MLQDNQTKYSLFSIRSLPVAIGALLFTVMGVLWGVLHEQEKTDLQNLVELQAQKQASYISADIRARMPALLRIVKRWEVRGGTPEEEFLQDANAYISDLPGFQSLQWMDKSLHVQWIEPSQENAQAQALNLAFEERQRAALEKARDHRLPTMTSAIDLVQGGKGFLIYFPIFTNNKFDGFLLAIFRIQAFLDYVFSPTGEHEGLKDFKLAVYFDDELIFKQLGWDTTPKYLTDLGAIADTHIMGHRFTVHVHPTESFIEYKHTAHPELAAMIGVFLSALIAYMVYLYQQLLHASKEINTGKMTLVHEVDERKQIEEVIVYENQLQAVLKNLLSIPLADRPLHDCLEEATDVLMSAPFSALQPKAGLFLVKPGAQVLELAVNYNLSEPLLTLCAQVPFGHCLCGRTVLEKKVIHATGVDHRHDIYFNKMHDHGHYNVPILLEEQVLGVITFYLPTGHQYHESEVSFLRSAAMIFAEIIERKYSEDSLIQHKEIAETLNRTKGEFLADMSHELRTPMHAILGFSEMGEIKTRSGADKKIHHYFSRIQESGNRLLFLLNDLLDLSKLEAGRMEFNFQAHDLAAVVDTAVTELKELAQKKALHIVVKSLTAETTACFDPERILQVVRNLLSNAIKFTPEEKAITISIEQGKLSTEDHTEIIPALSLVVSDEGIGVPEDELEAVFDKFVQSSKTRTDAGGTGLGLAICKEIIEGHGGTIMAQKNLQGGAVFTFTIPRQASAPSIEMP